VSNVRKCDSIILNKIKGVIHHAQTNFTPTTIMTSIGKEVPVNPVPAAAGIQGEQALLFIIRRKRFVGSLLSIY